MRTKGIVDQLGKLKAQIALLKEIESDLVQQLKDKGEGVKPGRLYDANIFWSSHTSTDWEAVVKAAKIPKRIITKYRSTKTFLVCTVTARIPRKRKAAA